MVSVHSAMRRRLALHRHHDGRGEARSEKRLEAHRSGKGAKYTRGRSPLELKYREGCGTHSDALKRELEIKHLSREEKLALIGETE